MRLPAALILCLWPPIGIAWLAFRSGTVEAGTVQRMDVEQLLGQCDQAFEGKVRSIRVLEPAHKRIETEITFAVTKRYWGDAGREFVLRIPGGVLPDGRGLVLPGLPSFSEGEELLLFLSAESRLGTRMPVGLAQGRLRIERGANGRKMLVRDQQDLEFYDPRTKTSSSAEARALFDYAALVARIEAAAQARKQRAARGDGK
jgi:hypothetical protein